MRVLFRVDSSSTIGSGHLMRCLTLAEELHRAGASITFVCRDLPGSLSRLVNDRGFGCLILPVEKHNRSETNAGQERGQEIDAGQTLAAVAELPDFDWLVVDHYGLDQRWEHRLRPRVDQILVVDDLADRRHDCDLLLDQNLTDRPATRYDALTPPHCRMMLGLSYLFLRREFHDARKSAGVRDGHIRRILLSFGGADTANLTGMTLAAIGSLDRRDLAVDVVIGQNHIYDDQITATVATMPQATLYHQVSNMADLMATADLAVGGGGSTTWERCCLGLPSLAVIMADNQSDLIAAADRRGVLWNIGRGEEMTPVRLMTHIQKALDNPAQIRSMSEAALGLIPPLQPEAMHPVAAAMREHTHAVG